MIRPFGVLLEVKLLDRVALGSVGQSGKCPWHGQPKIARVLRRTQRAPGGVLRRLEDLGEIARIHQFLPGIHIHQRRRTRRDKGSVRRRTNLCQAAEHLDIRRGMIELIVSNNATVGRAARSAIFLFVDLLEERTLVPGRALELFQGTPSILL